MMKEKIRKNKLILPWNHKLTLNEWETKPNQLNKYLFQLIHVLCAEHVSEEGKARPNGGSSFSPCSVVILVKRAILSLQVKKSY